MSSELGTSWKTPSVEILAERPPIESLDGVAEPRLLRIPSGDQADRETPSPPTPGQVGKSGLKARLLTVDVVAAGSTWLVLGAITLPGVAPGREWGAALAALVVTVLTMKLLRLYRRVCA